MSLRFERLDLSATGLQQVADLLSEVFPAAGYLSREFLDWSYCANPDGPACGFNAFDGTKLAAHYATQPLTAEIDGQPQRGLLSLHTATHPAFRGRGLFPQLAEQTYAAAAEAGFHFVVGVSNAASTRGFVDRLGFQHAGALASRLTFGRAPLPAKPLVPSFVRRWSEESLRWRLASPRSEYLIEVEARGTRIHAEIGRLRGLVELGFLARELPCKLPAPGALRPFRLWVGLDPRRPLSSLRHPHLPDALRPSPLNLIFRDLTGADRRLEPARVVFQALDFDAF